MKKNVMMRLASVLLVCVLLSTSVISGTFAKYVSSGDATATARVAKWGVEFKIESNDLFKPQYEYNPSTKPNAAAGDFSVKADTSTDVIAPGTSGTGYSFTTQTPVGTPEVSYLVTFDTSDVKTVFVDSYYPIKFALTLDGIASVESNDLASVMTALNDYQYMYDITTNHYFTSNDGGTTWIDNNTNIPKLALTWVWDYHVTDDIDVLDTKLGNLAAGYTASQVGATDYNLEVGFTVTATAEQID